MWPEGWWIMGRSEDVLLGKMLRCDPFGTPMILWRSMDGDLRLTGAHCPHYGADISTIGRVDWNELVCEYHYWHFDGAGRHSRCELEGSATNARLGTMPVRERNGFIYVYHGPRGSDPKHDPPLFEVQSWPRVLRHVIEADWWTGITDIGDQGHLNGMHGVRGTTAKWSRTAHPKTWQVEVEGDDFDIQTRVYAPSIVHSQLRVGEHRAEVICGSYPSGPGRHHATLAFYGGEGTDFLYQMFKTNLERDITIWEAIKPQVYPRYQPHDECLRDFIEWMEDLYAS